ncbi:MAG TPA: hypothetical protein VNG33_07245 [Polyangiaceae bacterium]|nr:hypothetical protein [Polyangiaceae bacterium]
MTERDSLVGELAELGAAFGWLALGWLALAFECCRRRREDLEACVPRPVALDDVACGDVEMPSVDTDRGA